MTMLTEEDLTAVAAECRAPQRAEPEPAPQVAQPCTVCGSFAVYSGGCNACDLERSRAKVSAELTSMVEGKLREYRESPFSCPPPCGEKILREGLCYACEERATARRLRRAHADGIREGFPRKHSRCDLDSPLLTQWVRPASAIATARAAMRSGVTSFTLLGRAGGGKTSLAAGLGHGFALRTGLEVAFLLATELAGARASCHLGEVPSEVTTALETDVLILDDLGSERGKGPGDVSDVLFSRHAHEQITIVTSGFELDVLESRYGSGIRRRLEDGACVLHLGEGEGG